METLRQMMDNNTAVLEQIAIRTSRFRTTKASGAPRSIFDMSFTTQSINYGDEGSVISSTLFSFDNEIVNSQVYRRTLAKAYANSKEDGQSQSAAPKPGSNVEQTQNQHSSHDNARDPTETPTQDEGNHSVAKEDLPVKLDALLLEATPEDPLITLLSEGEVQDSDWATFWTIKIEDIKNVSKDEIQLQNTLHELLTGEQWFLRSLQVFRFLYKHRLLLDSSVMTTSSRSPQSQGSIFPSCEDIYHANKTLLYDPLKSRQSNGGPFDSPPWEIYQNWFNQAGELYFIYAINFPKADKAIRREIEKNARFTRFLEQNREHRLGRKLGWDTYLKSPIVRLQRVSLMLQEAFWRSCRLDNEGNRETPEKLLKSIKSLLKRCDVAVAEEFTKLETDDIRSGLGLAGPRLLPDNVEMKIMRNMMYKESRYRNAYSVTVLLISKPNTSLVVLKDSAIKTLAEVSYDVLIALRPPFDPYSMHERSENPQQWDFQVSGIDKKQIASSITLITQNRDAAGTLDSWITTARRRT